MNNINPTIKLENVSMYYHDKDNVNIGINKINLSLYKGEFVIITGESGSGKTTLLNVIGASTPYHEGEIYYDLEPSSHFSDEERETFRRERIGYICQNYNLIDSYTLLQNVVASMLISGFTVKEAKIKALEYLDKVGLKELAHKKASQISSGQKQRLGIARALAKETDIILADEPTGNLDTENSIEIIKILKELSKDHLIIMVTHNIDDAVPYATRLVKLSGGHIILDEVKEENFIDCSTPDHYKLNNYKIAFTFSNFNRLAKPKRSILLALFFLIVSIGIFSLIGTIIINMDDTTTKIYDYSAFLHKDMTRLLVQRDDLAPITEEDLNAINNLKYVVQTDKYDLVNDYNYYFEEDLYYVHNPKYTYDAEGIQSEEPVEYHKDPVWINNNRFVRSSTCIKDSDILYGTRPNAVNEIAIYGEEADLGKIITISLAERQNWSSIGDYVQYQMKVTAVLKENEYVDNKQVYFSERLCKELIQNRDDNLARHNFYYTYFAGGKVQNRRVVIFTDLVGENNIHLAHGFFIDDYQVELYNPVSLDTRITYTYPGEYTITEYNEQMSLYMVKIDESKFDHYFGTVDSNQMSVYIEDYSYTDEVINAINRLNYNGFSTFRVSSIEYDQKILSQRNMTIAICTGAIFIIFLLSLFVLGAFLSLNKHDYLLLRFLGMNKQAMYYTNFFEMLSITCVMYIISLIGIFVLRLFKVKVVINLIKYMAWYQFIVIFIVIFVIVLATTYRFNKRLQKESFDFGGDNL